MYNDRCFSFQLPLSSLLTTKNVVFVTEVVQAVIINIYFM
jgi:hypothetical protein